MQAINLKQSSPRYCEKQLIWRNKRQLSCRKIKSELAGTQSNEVTKQSHVVNSLIKVFDITSEKLLITPLEQKDCFADGVKPNRVYFKVLPQPRLAMTGGVRYESC
jgi:hypothetical protein